MSTMSTRPSRGLRTFMKKALGGSLPDFFVCGGPLATGKRVLSRVLATGKELDVQRVLQQYPDLLVQDLLCGMGWVIPQKRLGSQFVTDFLVGEDSSAGRFWKAIELESPRVPMFTKAGDPSRLLVHAIRQIQDWRAWLVSNQAYASRPRLEHGLGLVDISPQLPGRILIGRRHLTNSGTSLLRRQMSADLRIEIRSYDSLLDRPHQNRSD